MEFTITLPAWVDVEVAKLPPCLPTVEERMSHVIRFSRMNMERNTGGPFAAGVFNDQTGELVAIGVNRVVPENCSSAHAEVVALSIAQAKLRSFDLGGQAMPPHQLVVNWRPCAMCYGALIWSGVRSLAIAGSTSELEKLTGFDEGPIHPDWKSELHDRGIVVIDGVLKSEACDVFRDFRASGRLVYNGRRGS